MINILIVANQKSVGQAWQAYLNAESDLQVVGLAANGNTALDKIAQLQPDIVLIDLKIPQLDGLKTTQLIRDRFPQTKTIVFNDNSDHSELYQAIAAGAQGYLLKNTPSNEIVHTIRYVNKGYFELAPGLLEKLLSQLNNNSHNRDVVALEQQLKGYLYQLEDLIKTEPKQLINGTLNQLRDQLISTLDLKLYSVKNKQGEIIQVIKRFQHKLYIFLIAQNCLILFFIFYYLLFAK
ncbi:response regulator [Stanieria sp. NIES-3757]|nr:response regulator [Stanieria sp. NIES-3757]